MKTTEMNEIITALVTPFDTSGQVNLPVVRQVVRHNLAMGVRCLYVCGSTGEGFSLSPAERKSVAEVACDELRGKGGVIVNVSHLEFDVAVELAAHARQAGAVAVSSLPPLYYPVTRHEIERYFLRLLDRVELPMTLYNIPMLSRIALDQAMAARLAEDPKFVGIKHSTEDTFLLSQFKKIAGGRLTVWSGRDAYYLGGLAMGADGAIGSSFNLMGDLFIRITHAYRAGQVERARLVQARTNDVHWRLQTHGGVQSIKRCLQLMGIDVGGCRLPYQSPPPELDPYFRETLEILDAVRREVAELPRHPAEGGQR